MRFPVPLDLLDDSITALKLSTPRGPAPLPVPNPTRSFWTDSSDTANPLAKHGSTGPLPTDTEICIIGSGITGVSAAYHLSRLYCEAQGKKVPCNVMILEARDFCSGATGRNGGHLTASYFNDFCMIERDHGRNEALKNVLLERHTVAEMVALIELHSWGKDIDLVPGGHTTLIFSDKEDIYRRADFAAAKDAGADVSQVEWLDKQDVFNRFGALYPAFRTPGYNLWPLKLVTKLFLLAQGSTTTEAVEGPARLASSESFSLTLHTNTPVTGIRSSNSPSSSYRWEVVTPRGLVRTKYIIHATNAYVSHLLPQFTGPHGVVPTRCQVIATRASVPLSQLSLSGFGANSGFEYWFPRPVTTAQKLPLVILGGGREVTKDTGYEYYETDDSLLNEKVSAVLRKFLPTILPGKFALGKDPEMEWTGIIGETQTGDPFVGPVPNSAGQYVAAGYSGHGMPRAYCCTEIVATMIIADMNKEIWKAPSWFPVHYLTVSM